MGSILKGFREHKLHAPHLTPGTKEFTKFALVGLTSLVVEYSVLLLLVELLHVDYLVSTTLAFILSVVVNYYLSLRFVFDHRDLYMFVGVTMFNIGYQLMKLISTFFVTWYNYFSRRHFLASRA